MIQQVRSITQRFYFIDIQFDNTKMHPSFKKLPLLPLQIIEQSILSSPTLNNAELVICLNELLCPFIYSKFWN